MLKKAVLNSVSEGKIKQLNASENKIELSERQDVNSRSAYLIKSDNFNLNKQGSLKKNYSYMQLKERKELSMKRSEETNKLYPQTRLYNVNCFCSKVNCGCNFIEEEGVNSSDLSKRKFN